jgi:hypothetical protein
MLAAYLALVKVRSVPAHGMASRESISKELAEFSAIRASDRVPRFMFFRYTGVDADYGKLALVDLRHRDQMQIIEGLSCESVHFTGGHGICLSANRGVFTTYAAQIFDTRLRALYTIPLNGGPSRSRVSRDGSTAACTVFVSGHGYNSVDFSTRTLLIDTATGKVMASLEDFRVTKDGQPFRAADFNFWGVTFTPDSRHFYCTLSSNHAHYLVECDIAGRSGRVVHENAECPSVSPDGTRVAYKKRFIVDNRLIWQLHMLDLATMKETPLPEKRSVDDQIEWLDNRHVLYAVSENPQGSSATTDVWTADVEGESAPELFLAKAYSPAVVR